MKALYANDKDAASVSVSMEAELDEMKKDMRGERIRLYFQEGERTPDLRVLDPNSVNFNRPPPYSIRLQTVQPESGGHAGAVVCGVIDAIMRDGLTIIAEGRLDMNSPSGIEAERLIREGIMATWSPDLGDATVDIEEDVEDEDSNTPQEALAHFVKATFLGATLVPMPALASAVVELLTADGTVLTPAPVRQVAETEGVGESTDPDEHKQIIERNAGEEAISACASPELPPAAFFSDPKLASPQRYVTITPQGHVFGHLACWGECHIGYQNTCIDLEPGESTYDYFHIGQVKTAEGILVATGVLSVTGGHAHRDMDVQASQSHYDNPANGVADVRLGEDAHGIYFSGALRPHATEDQVRILRASGVSGDWRRIEGTLELIGACSVNIPGFPKVKVRMAASGEDAEPEVLVLVAAGGIPLPAPEEDCGCLEDLTDEELRDLAKKMSSIHEMLSELTLEKLERDINS